jgi:hypothetical protein
MGLFDNGTIDVLSGDVLIYDRVFIQNVCIVLFFELNQLFIEVLLISSKFLIDCIFSLDLHYVLLVLNISNLLFTALNFLHIKLI